MTSPGAPLRTGPILLVEDEVAIQRLVQDTLEAEGHEVVATGDGEDAFRALESMQPALILLDMRLPTMDGTEFVRRYLSDHPDDAAPVIMMTANRPEDGLPDGVAGYVAKPFDLDDFVATVGRVVRPGAAPG
ncbi:MAG: response regulator [Dehalococcoidia bacterium]